MNTLLKAGLIHASFQFDMFKERNLGSQYLSLLIFKMGLFTTNHGVVMKVNELNMENNILRVKT